MSIERLRMELDAYKEPWTYTWVHIGGGRRGGALGAHGCALVHGGHGAHAGTRA